MTSIVKVDKIVPATGTTTTLGESGDTIQLGDGATAVGFGSYNRNLIINGAMQVSQRGTQTGQGGSNVYSAVDRWEFVTSSAARVTTSRDVNGLGNFPDSLKIDCTTAHTSISASDQAGIRTKLECQDLQHLLWGTASAKTLALRFTVSSPKAGIHCVQAHNRDADYSYVQEFTVTSANTAEEFTLTIPGDTSNGFSNDFVAGLEICFPLHNGTNWQTTSGSWQSGNFFSTGNQQNLLDNVGNKFYLTGVQLEVGDVATPFEHISSGDTFVKCQRYYETSARTSYIGIGGQSGWLNDGTGAIRSTISFNTPKRASPTMSYSALSTNWSAVTITASYQGFGPELSTGSTTKDVRPGFLWIADSEL